MKIEINKIEFRNLFSYGNKWSEFSPNGISFITGKNIQTDRRNFTGKSNLLKIFPYSLFGTVAGLNKSRMVNWKNRKQAESIITLTKGTDTFKIHRGIKPDILEVYQNDKKLPEPPNKKDFQKQIENDILEMDYSSFMNIVYADTNNTSSILRMSKPMKRIFLEQIFNLEYFTQLKDKANKKLTSVSNKIEKEKSNIQNKENSIEDLKNEIKKYESSLNDFDDSNDQLKNKKKELSNLQEKYNESLKKLNENREDLQNIINEKNKTNEILIKVNYKIKELKKNLIGDIFLIDYDEIQKNIKENNNKIKELDNQINENEKNIVDLPEEQLEEEKDTLLSDASVIKSDYNRAKENYKNTQEQIENKTTQKTCPTCFQEVDHEKIEEHLNTEKEKYKIEVKTLKENYNKKATRLKKVKESLTKLKELREKRDKLLNEKKEYENDNNENNKLLNEYEEQQKQINKSNRYEKAIKKLELLQNTLHSKFSNSEQEITETEKQITSDENIIKKYETIENEVKQLESDVKKAKEYKKKVNSWIKDSNDKIKELTSEIKSCNNDIVKYNTTKDYISVLKDLCGDDKGKQYTISNKIPLLNQRVNFYLSKAGVNYYVKLDNFLEVEIRGPGIKDCSYDNLSGAEKVSLDRALQFSLNDVNKLQSPSHMDLLILDEILDSSVDTLGMQNIINIVKTKQQEDNSNVLIVSHRESFEEMNDFIDNFYCVENDGKYSQLKKI